MADKTLATLMLAVLVINTCHALPEDRQQPLVATSQQAQMYQNTLTGIYTGNVVAHQGTTLLTANQAIIQLDQQHQVKSAIAVGSEQIPAVYTTVMHPNEAPLVAKAKRIEYYPQTFQVVLLGNAIVTHNKDTYTSQTIYYNTNTQTVVSPKIPGERTTIVIQPQPKTTKSS